MKNWNIDKQYRRIRFQNNSICLSNTELLNYAFLILKYWTNEGKNCPIFAVSPEFYKSSKHTKFLKKVMVRRRISHNCADICKK